jgi:aminoglycoside/choline kinase family phosphotransferase
MTPQNQSPTGISNAAREFLASAGWGSAAGEVLAGDASSRRYFRLRLAKQTAVLMDASQNLDSVAPFVAINHHLQRLGFSAPNIIAQAQAGGFLLLEDFGDATFTRLLDEGRDPDELFALGVDVLIALHRRSQAIPPGLRAYHPQKMLEDIELYLQWRTPTVSDEAKKEFRTAWLEVLPVAHQVPASLLLRDFHAANLMLLPDREGIRRVGMLDFQDAYQGPVAYDLMSLLEDARRDVPETLRTRMMARYLAGFPSVNPETFGISTTILAAQRHTRVLAIFERLSRRDGKHDYRKLHSPRVELLLRNALSHPILAAVKRWMERYGW